MSTNATVFVGFWTDWSKGVVKGSTLTLSARNGGILISILSLFIQLTSGQSWGIICFLLHQWRTTTEVQDGLYHQQQATLRNNTSDAGTSWNLAKIGWAWRSHTNGSIRKTFILVLVGAVHLLLFGAAGILASHIVIVGNEVLLAKNPSCGSWLYFGVSNESSFVEAVDLTLFQENNIALSSQYVHNCLTQTQSSPVCNSFKTSQLNQTSTTNVPCPFEDGLCLGLANSSLRLDTGLIDSRNDLGINGDDAHRVQYRKTSICNPITTDGYWKSGMNTVDGTSYNFSAAFYGPNNALVSANDDNGGIDNATYVHSNFAEIVLNYDLLNGSPYYVVSPQSAYPTAPGLGFTPIQALFAPNRSVTLVFASFSGTYTGPSDDLWLSSHTRFNQTTNLAGNESIILPFYISDQTISVLACTEQHQFCNPNPASNKTQNCTSFLSRDQFVTDGLLGGGPLDAILDNDYQRTVASIIMFAAYTSDMNTVLQQLNPPLLAAGLVANGASPPLPDNQWVLEASNWFSIGMANIQRMVVNTATGPPGNDAQYTLNQAEDDPTLQWYCANQIIQREDFTSFSVLAMALIFSVGGIIICLSMFIETVVGWLQLRYRRGLYHQIRWQLDSTLQLQRMAFEEMGLGIWRGGADDVPVTHKGQVFGPSKEWDEWHPSIRGKSVGKREGSVKSGAGSYGSEISGRNFF